MGPGSILQEDKKWKAHARCRPQWGELPYVETTVQDGPGERGTLGVRVGNREVGTEAEVMARKDQALATIVLAVEASLLYLLGDPKDPAEVWEQLSKQFQRRTWANKLRLRKKLFTMRLKEGDSMKEHIKQMTEVFGELAVIDEPVSEEDKSFTYWQVYQMPTTSS